MEFFVGEDQSYAALDSPTSTRTDVAKIDAMKGEFAAMDELSKIDAIKAKMAAEPEPEPAVDQSVEIDASVEAGA